MADSQDQQYDPNAQVPPQSPDAQNDYYQNQPQPPQQQDYAQPQPYDQQQYQQQQYAQQPYDQQQYAQQQPDQQQYDQQQQQYYAQQQQYQQQQYQQQYYNQQYYGQQPAQPPKKKGKWLLFGCLGCGGLIVLFIALIGYYVWSFASKPESLLDVDSWVSRKIIVSAGPAMVEQALDNNSSMSSEEKSEIRNASNKIFKAIDEKKITSSDLSFLRERVKKARESNSSSQPDVTEEEVEKFKNLMEKADVDLKDFPNIQKRFERQLLSQ